jgi:hypothetical protein
MTKLLEQAISEANKLSDTDQDVLARLMLEEIDSERRWDDLFGRSQDVLERMAAEALAEQAAGHQTSLIRSQPR